MQCLNVPRFSFSSPFARWLISRSSSTKLFVGGLSYDTNETILKDVFELHGEITEEMQESYMGVNHHKPVSKGVTLDVMPSNTCLTPLQISPKKSAEVICDHRNGKSKGYGFVHFTTKTAAINALKEMDGKLLDGRNIRIQYAHKS